MNLRRQQDLPEYLIVFIHFKHSFGRLTPYFRGNHHLEEVMYYENLRRSQLLTLLDKFRDVLFSCQHEDPVTLYFYSSWYESCFLFIPCFLRFPFSGLAQDTMEPNRKENFCVRTMNINLTEEQAFQVPELKSKLTRILVTRSRSQEKALGSRFEWDGVIAHTFCASRDTRVSYDRCLLIQGYFCAV